MQFHSFEDQVQTSAPCPPLVASSPLLPVAILPIYLHNLQRYGAAQTAPVLRHLAPHSLQSSSLSNPGSHNNYTPATTTATTTTAITTMAAPIYSDHGIFQRPLPYLCDPMEEQMRRNNVLFQEAIHWARILDGSPFMDSTTGDNEEEPPGSFSSPQLRPPIQRVNSCRSSGTSFVVKASTIHAEESYPRAPTLMAGRTRRSWFSGVNTQWARQRGPTMREMIDTMQEHGWRAAVEKIGAAFLIALIPGIGVLICLVLTIVKVYIPLARLHIQEGQLSLLRRTLIRGLLVDLLIGLVAPIGPFVRLYFLYGISTNLAMARIARQGLITHADECTRTFNHRAAANSPSNAFPSADAHISASGAACPPGTGNLVPFMPSSNVWARTSNQLPLSRAQILARNKHLQQETPLNREGPAAIPILDPRRNDANKDEEIEDPFLESLLGRMAPNSSSDNPPQRRQQQIQTHRSMEQKVLGAWEQHHLRQLEQQRHQERRMKRMSSLSLESSYSLAAAEAAAAAAANKDHDPENDNNDGEKEEGEDDQELEEKTGVNNRCPAPNNMSSAEHRDSPKMSRVQGTPCPAAFPRYCVQKSPCLVAAAEAVSQNSSANFGSLPDYEKEEEERCEDEDDWDLAGDDNDDDDDNDEDGNGQSRESGSFRSPPPQGLLLTTPPLFTTSAGSGSSQRSGDLDSSISGVLTSREFFGHTPPAFMTSTKVRMVDASAYRPSTNYISTRRPNSVTNASMSSSSSIPSQTTRQQMHPRCRRQSILFPSPHFRNSDVTFKGSIVHQEPTQKEELEEFRRVDQ